MEWTFIDKRSKHRMRTHNSRKHNNYKISALASTTTADAAAAKYRSQLYHVQQSQFWKTLRNGLDQKPREKWLLAYGLGHFENAAPQAQEVFLSQLALASLIKNELFIETQNTFVSDPLAVTLLERDLIEKSAGLVSANHLASSAKLRGTAFLDLPERLVNIKEDTTTEAVDRITSAKSNHELDIVLFMPHCEKHLYGDAFRFFSNWANAKRSLSCNLRLILIGNELSLYENSLRSLVAIADNRESNASRKDAMAIQDAQLFLDQVLQFGVVSTRICDNADSGDNADDVGVAFNDLAITIISDKQAAEWILPDTR